ncbi:MAG TPA: hypothetical protein VMV90_13820 [Rectinemataceae bacterium]|nr:hypothetical protein [Rectinemataceae bacterium]
MKRTIIVLAIALATAGMAFAQQNGGTQNAQPPFGGPGYGRMMGGFAGGSGYAATPVTLEGKLVFIDQYPALQTKDATYMLRMPRFYYYAYTDNIREGAQMKVQGFVLPTFPGQDKPFVMVRSATIGSKTYDFSAFGPRGGCFGGREGSRGGPGYGMGGYGPRGGMMGGYGQQGGGW